MLCFFCGSSFSLAPAKGLDDSVATILPPVNLALVCYLTHTQGGETENEMVTFKEHHILGS